MDLLQFGFWTCCAIVGYTYLGYPLLLLAVASIRRRPRRVETLQTSISMVMAVRNESAHLLRRLDELTAMVRTSGSSGEILVVSDGSTDETVNIARAFEDRGVRVLALDANQGKAAALSQGIAAAQHEIVVFADARQRWADDALTRLVENFADPEVGAVSGDLVLEAAPGVMAGVGLYWRFEKWLRRTESAIGSQVGVTGAISAARRALLPAAIPPGTLLDDVYWPLCVAMSRHRVVHDERAKAFDRLPDRPRDELSRKVRTLAGNFQLLALLPASLLPWRNPVWLPWISHKLLRLVVPWCLLGMLASSAALVLDPLYAVLFALQLAGYLTALAGLIPALGNRLRLLAAGASFLALNTAAWLAFWVWITGQAGQSWRKVNYGEAADG
jgi:cellulose synthase/poly-beta-1,6-N-acetylglucosamine synthase-like glycosyltransferase